MLRLLGTWRWARRSRAMVRRLRSVTWRLRMVRPPPSPRVVPCVVLIRGIRYVGTRPIPSQRHALAPNATYLSRTPRTCPERRTSGPNVTHLARRAINPRRLGAWHCATARSDGWFRLSAVWAHWPTFYKKWARGR